MAPTGRLFASLPVGQDRHHAEKNLRRKAGIYLLQQLESLVGEIERVATAKVEVVGRCGKDHVGKVRKRVACHNSRVKNTHGADAVAYLDKLAKPGLKPLRLDMRLRQGIGKKKRGLVRHHGGNMAKTVVERQRPIACL